MNSFQDRLKEIIGTQKIRAFARKCGIAEGSLRNYLVTDALPGTENLVAMARAGEVELQWLATGEGSKRKEEKDHALIAEKPEPYQTKPGFKISEDLTLAAQVLESETPYAIALHLNIQSFASALKIDSRVNQLEQKFQAEIADLRKQIANLQEKQKQAEGPISSERKAM